MRLPAPPGGKGVSDNGNSPYKGTEAGKCKECSKKAPDSEWLVREVEVGPGFSNDRPSACSRTPDAFRVCSGKQEGWELASADSWEPPGAGSMRSLERGAGRTVTESRTCLLGFCLDTLAQPSRGLELEAGGGNKAETLVLKRKGKGQREKMERGREAQTASCFAKLKIDFSTVLFRDKSLHSSAILA